MSKNEVPTFVLKKFDMKKIPKDATVVFIGKRRTGKSTLVKDYLYHNGNQFKAGTIISGTEKMNKFYSKFYPQLFIHYKATPEILGNILKAQEKIIISNEKKSGDSCKPHDPYSFLILDDCFGDDSWTKDEQITEIFLNGRHYKLNLLIPMQYPLGLGPKLRSNIDYVFLLNQTSPKLIRTIYENYCQANLDFNEFRSVLDLCTENNGALVIDNTTKSKKLEDQIFHYTAVRDDDERYKGWKLGSKELWDYHNRKFNKKSD